MNYKEFQKAIAAGQTKFDELELTLQDEDLQTLQEHLKSTKLSIRSLKLIALDTMSETERFEKAHWYSGLFKSLTDLEELKITFPLNNKALIAIFADLPQSLEFLGLIHAKREQKSAILWVNTKKFYWDYLVQFLQKHPNLKHLDIADSNNDLTEENYPSFFKAIAAHPGLTPTKKKATPPEKEIRHKEVKEVIEEEELPGVIGVTLNTAPKKTYPDSYFKLIEGAPNDLAKATRILRDYVKHESFLLGLAARFFTCHLGRKHVTVVNTLLNRIASSNENVKISSIERLSELLGCAERSQSANPEGSFSRRINFIREHCKSTSAQPDQAQEELDQNGAGTMVC